MFLCLFSSLPNIEACTDSYFGYWILQQKSYHFHFIIPFFDRISSSKVYGAVPPPQQLLAGVDTSGAKSDAHYTLGPNVLSGASHSFATIGVVAPAVTMQSGAPTYSGVPPPSNMAYPIPPVNGGAFYSGYGDIYPQATPLQQVAFTLKHASSSAAQAVPMTSTPTSMVIKENSTLDVEMDKRSRRKFQELPVSKGLATESQVQSVLFFFPLIYSLDLILNYRSYNSLFKLFFCTSSVPSVHLLFFVLPLM